MTTKTKGVEDLTTTQATLYRSYVATNTKGISQQKEITRLCKLGTEGHEEIIIIAELLKANKELTATIKVQVSRAMAKLKTGLTLQGLGKTDDDVVIAKKSTDNEPVEGSKPAKPEDSVEAGTVSVTREQAWDFVAKYFTLDDVMALVEEVKANRTPEAKAKDVAKLKKQQRAFVKQCNDNLKANEAKQAKKAKKAS
tara:strand:+ start:98 stop:688 length:591 start_codon:yes stop_codon:yes gene_type:complete